MKTYRLMIYQHERLLGHFDSAVPWAREAVSQIVARLSRDEGYRLELLESYDERRLVESTPEGMRLIYSELIFCPSVLDEG